MRCFGSTATVPSNNPKCGTCENHHAIYQQELQNLNRGRCGNTCRAAIQPNKTLPKETRSNRFSFVHMHEMTTIRAASISLPKTTARHNWSNAHTSFTFHDTLTYSRFVGGVLNMQPTSLKNAIATKRVSEASMYPMSHYRRSEDRGPSRGSTSEIGVYPFVKYKLAVACERHGSAQPENSDRVHEPMTFLHT